MRRKLGSRKFKGHPFLYHLDDLLDFYPASWHFRIDQKIQNKYFNIQPGEIFFDVGATFGSWTLPALAVGAKVWAFEPHPLFLPLLEDNIVVNGFGFWNTVPKMVWSKSHSWEKFYPYAMSAKKNSGLRSDKAVFLVETITLDDITIQSSPVNWIKIDVEGAEVEVLKGAQETLKRWHPKIILEHHRDLCEDFRPFLKDYKIEEIEDGKFFCS